MYELDNPYDLEDYEDDEGMVLIEEKPRKRRRKKNPEPPIVMATPILLLGLGYAAWVLYNQVTHKVWSFTPWKLAGRSRLQLRRTNLTEEAQRQQARRQAEFDKAIEQSLKPTVYTVEEVDVWKKPITRDSEREIVSFITP